MRKNSWQGTCGLCGVSNQGEISVGYHSFRNSYRAFLWSLSICNCYKASSRGLFSCPLQDDKLDVASDTRSLDVFKKTLCQSVKKITRTSLVFGSEL